MDNFEVWSQPIDYDEVHKRIKTLREESREYLIKALDGVNK
jgi:hypothetical protein